MTNKMNKQKLLSYLKEAQTHLSEIEKHTRFHNEIINLLKELDNRNEEVAISWSMYLFKG